MQNKDETNVGRTISNYESRMPGYKWEKFRILSGLFFFLWNPTFADFTRYILK